MKSRATLNILPALILGTMLPTAWAQRGVGPGDQAPMLVSVDQNMRRIDMSDMIDGTPLVLLYGSAT